MSKIVIPSAVIEAAKKRASLGSGKLAPVGSLKGVDIYSFQFDEPMTIGLPELYAWDGSSVQVVTGSDAEEMLYLLSSFYDS